MLLTATPLSRIQRSSHSRLQSQSRNAVWNSLQQHASISVSAPTPFRRHGDGGCDLQRLERHQAVKGPRSDGGEDVPRKVPGRAERRGNQSGSG